MFSPLVTIRIASIYKNGPLPARMARCTPDMYAAICALRDNLPHRNAALVLSDLFRTYDMQYQAYLDYVTGKKAAYSPPPGGSMHEAGRAFDLDINRIRRLTLPAFWPVAAAEGLTPIIDQPDIRAKEAWHFDCRGSHQRVYDYYASGKGDNFKSPYKAMAASAIVSIGVKVYTLGDDARVGYIQSGLIRLGHDIGDLDGKVGPKTRQALQDIGLDPSASIDDIAGSVDMKLQDAFPKEYFVPGQTTFEDVVPDHLAAGIAGAATSAVGSAAGVQGYRPPQSSVAILGSIVEKLTGAQPISRAFVSKVALLAKLPSGEIYFDSSLELDTDGWPGGQGAGDLYWQPDTALHYANGSAINANAVPFFVLPLPGNWWGQFGVSLGDYAAVIYKNRLAYAVFGDLGPKKKLGEGSLQLLRELGAERIRNGKVIDAGIEPNIVTIVFPGSGASADRKDEATLLAAIANKARTLFVNLGGLQEGGV